MSYPEYTDSCAGEIWLGDVEGAVCALLEESVEIQALGARVAPDLVGRTEAGKPPWAVVTLAGGRLTYPLPFRPRVQFHVYAETRGMASDLARIIQMVLIRDAGTFSAEGVVIASATVRSDLVSSPDIKTSEPGYVFLVELACTPGL